MVSGVFEEDPFNPPVMAIIKDAIHMPETLKTKSGNDTMYSVFAFLKKVGYRSGGGRFFPMVRRAVGKGKLPCHPKRLGPARGVPPSIIPCNVGALCVGPPQIWH